MGLNIYVIIIFEFFYFYITNPIYVSNINDNNSFQLLLLDSNNSKARFIPIKGQLLQFYLIPRIQPVSRPTEKRKLAEVGRSVLNIRNERLLTRDTGCENYANVARAPGSSPGQSVIHAACVHKRRDAIKPRLSALFSSRRTLFPLG